MTVWVVRVVDDLAKEREALELGTCITGFDRVPDFRTFIDSVAIMNALSKLYPAKNNAGLGAWSSQMLAFRDSIQVGDYVLMPSKINDVLHVGVVSGPYDYAKMDGKARHQRKVKWCGKMRKEDARATGQGSIGTFLAVFRVDKPHFVAAVQQIVEKQPGPKT